MRTIEEIRLENFHALVKELAKEFGTELGDGDVAAQLGLSKVYVWQLRKGKRSKIESSAARKIEENAEKSIGWMDTDFKLWPFPGIDPGRFDALTYEQRIEIQGAVRERLDRFEQDKAGRVSKNGTNG